MFHIHIVWREFISDVDYNTALTLSVVFPDLTLT